MNAVASGLIEAIKLAINNVSPPYNSSNYPPSPTGTDWDYIPTGAGSWFKFGAGGGMHWGTLCGVPNGCMVVLNLMNLATSAYVDQIMLYFSQTEFPSSDLYDIYTDLDYQYLFGGKVPQPDVDVKAHTISNSPLCHVSISKWCYAAGIDMTVKNAYGIPHKVDRCAKMAGDVAAFTAELLNGITSNLEIPETTEFCYNCHNAGVSPYTAQQGHMDCLECHTDMRPHTHVTKYLVIEDVWTADGFGVAKDTFRAGDSIQYKVKFSVVGPLTSFVKTVKSRAAGTCGKILGLPKSETLMSGNYVWTWSDTVPNSCSGSAKVIMNMEMYDYNGGNLQAQAKKIHNFTIE
ncbi:MAG: hypothetical protein ACUVUQ_06440 [Thermodesulfovibrionales bacterium]